MSAVAVPRAVAQTRGERALKLVAYVLVGLPLGAAYLVVFAGGLVLAALGLVWIGLPLLLAAIPIVYRSAVLERVLANRLLDARIPPIPRPQPNITGSVVSQLRERLSRVPFWRAVALLALKLPVALLTAAAVGFGLVLMGALIVLGVRGLSGDGGFVGPFSLGPVLGVVLLLLALPAAVMTVAIGDAVASVLRWLARALLATYVPPGSPVRETLARSLGDRTLSIAYWLPDRRTFVDERGHPVPLPEPGSDRAWTAVDSDGRRVAAIIHDANLDASADLVQAAAAAASLALDNERLKADLRARVEELRASRVRIVQAADSARRKLERDLHDGAQQQLVALAIDLRLLRSRLGTNDAAKEMIDRIDQKLAAALAELRELARGIHPAILTDRGLEPAISSIAERAPIPIAVEIDIERRAPAPVEAAAYFVVAEAITNVLKYADATSAIVRARREEDDIVVEVQDDGVGGADEGWGSGLRGLADRVGALDGVLTIISPPGAGTLVRARLPCGADALVAEASAGAAGDVAL